MTRYANQVKCPECGRRIAVRELGLLYPHKAGDPADFVGKRPRCPGSGVWVPPPTVPLPVSPAASVQDRSSTLPMERTDVVEAPDGWTLVAELDLSRVPSELWAGDPPRLLVVGQHGTWTVVRPASVVAMSTHTCLLCGAPGRPRDCCPHAPALCDAHNREHRHYLHDTGPREDDPAACSPRRSLDELLEEDLHQP
jgi:hypothetical protein